MPIIKKYLSRRTIIAVCILTTLGGGGWLAYSIGRTGVQAGVLNSAETHSGENLSRSLDLRLAAKASYLSSPLGLVKNLGTSGGIKRQIVSFSVKTDGLTEYAMLMEPAAPVPAAGFPAIILCHGYIKPADYDTTLGYISDMEFYAGHGFAVIKPDFRGQGLSSGQGLPEGAYYSMAYNTDVMSLISALKQTTYINKTDINLWGHSMGAYIALRAAVLSPDIKNVILLSGPVGSLKQIYLSYVPPSDENNPEALDIRNDAFSKYGTPAEDSNFWKYASPSTYLGAAKANFQIHVGSLDPIVPPELSADLDASLTTAHKQHEYFVYPDGRHGLMLQRQSIWSRSLDLLQKK